MAPKQKKETGAQLGVRVDAQTLKRLDVLRERFALPGAELGRADIARAAILAGLDVLEKRSGPHGR